MYQTATPGIKTYAPRTCECGVSLIPYVGDAQEGEFSACALCVKCYVTLRTKHGGRIPPADPIAKN